MNLSPNKAFEENEDIKEFPPGLSFWRETWASAKSMSSDTAEETSLSQERRKSRAFNVPYHKLKRSKCLQPNSK
jgi:hypothetical protein